MKRHPLSAVLKVSSLKGVFLTEVFFWKIEILALKKNFSFRKRGLRKNFFVFFLKVVISLKRFFKENSLSYFDPRLFRESFCELRCQNFMNFTKISFGP